MNVDVRYFAAAREASGLERESITLDAGATVALLRERLLAQHPSLEAIGSGLRIAVGQRFAAADTRLDEGAEVALIPPVSGG